MSDPTGNALRSAQEPDAMEARLLALVEDWRIMAESRSSNPYGDAESDGRSGQQRECADELLAALRGDA